MALGFVCFAPSGLRTPTSHSFSEVAKQCYSQPRAESSRWRESYRVSSLNRFLSSSSFFYNTHLQNTFVRSQRRSFEQVPRVDFVVECSQNGSDKSGEDALIKRSLAVIAAIIAIGTAVNVTSPPTSRLTLSSLADSSVPLETALRNGRPSVVEFFAEWCEGCREMVGDVAALEKTFGDDVNFVMLNVDNTKWIPELSKYDVDGIPHFEFLGKNGDDLGHAIGKQPRSVLESNVKALADGVVLPYAEAPEGETSDIKSGTQLLTKARVTDPRGHSNLPVQPPPS